MVTLNITPGLILIMLIILIIIFYLDYEGDDGRPDTH